MKLHHVVAALALTLLGACAKNHPAVIPFSTGSVRAVALDRVIADGYPTSPTHDTLAADRIAEFVEGLRGARELGPGKALCPYRINFTLTGGEHFTLVATETTFSTSGDGRYYAFNTGRYFLRRYFPAAFADTVGTVENI
jgi:hypothetical protein